MSEINEQKDKGAIDPELAAKAQELVGALQSGDIKVADIVKAIKDAAKQPYKPAKMSVLGLTVEYDKTKTSGKIIEKGRKVKALGQGFVKGFKQAYNDAKSVTE